MFGGIRRRMSPGAVLGTIAVIFAMTGGAYAAGAIKITSIKQIKPSVVKQLKGKEGARGATGAAGAAGPAGAAGAAGKEGAKGAEGPKGETGKEGAPGPKGEKGQPWVPDNTLPSGAEETGVWGMSKLPGTLGVGQLQVPISFPIQLVSPLPGPVENPITKELESHVHVIEEGETGAAGKGCGGGTGEAPTAEPGNLCVYVTSENEAPASAFLVADPATGEPGAGSTGAILTSSGSPTLPAGAFAHGVWAVRAE